MKKLLSILLTVMMLLGSMAYAETAPVTIINFADSNHAFFGVETTAGNADACELSVVEYNGGYALRVDVHAKVPYIALNIEGLLGENYPCLASMSFDVGAELGSDGKFYAQTGQVITVTGEDQVKTGYTWSVYLRNKNPKSAKVELKNSTFTAGQGEYLLITKETDNFINSGRFVGEEPRDIYLTNLQFFDAQGNALPLDLTAEWTGSGAEADLSNLSVLTNKVDFSGFVCEGNAWGQNGFSMPEEFRAALVPGSVIEVSFESADGSLWLVFPDSAAGWVRVGDGGRASINNSRTTAQITYEQIAALLGEDVSAWGDRLQCEAASNWKVYSVSAGQGEPRMALTQRVDFSGFTCEGGAWAQNGFSIPQEVRDALNPGTALEISYESDDGSIWLVFPDSAAGWMRVAQGEAKIMGDRAYITYEQIATVLGEDKAAWGDRLQCEAAASWKVYGVSVGKVNELVGMSQVVEFPGYACSGNAWAQDGLSIPENVRAALVPGSVVTISYESQDGSIWLVFPDSAAGWMRIPGETADTDGQIAQFTFEEIAAVLGEDISTWGDRMQCEAASNWTVYAITIGLAH